MKKILLLITVMAFLSGCSTGNASQDAYDTLVTDYEQLKSENTQLQDALSQAEALSAELEGSLEALTKSNDELKEEVKVLEESLGTLSDQLIEETMSSNQTPSVVTLAEEVVILLKNQDFQGLSTHVHPNSGVRLTPYPFIDIGTDLVMNASQIAAFPTDNTIYNWGNYDGSGDPISLNPMDYYWAFIYDHDFALPEMLAWNSPIGSGNMINNMSAAYPTADYVEFHFSGFDPQFDGMDWSSLTLVFEQMGGTWYLVGIVHGQWTT